MINSLRDKAELEELYAQMAEKSAEVPAMSVRVNEPARLDEGTVLVTDLRGLPATVGEGDASFVISAVERAMRLQEHEVERQDARCEISGHRLVSVFRGDRGIITRSAPLVRSTKSLRSSGLRQCGRAVRCTINVDRRRHRDRRIRHRLGQARRR
jgi:hypothetical protein